MSQTPPRGSQRFVVKHRAPILRGHLPVKHRASSERARRVIHQFVVKTGRAWGRYGE